MKIESLRESLLESLSDSDVEDIKGVIKSKNISLGTMKPLVKGSSIVIIYWTDKTTSRKMEIEGTDIVSDDEIKMPAFEIARLKSLGYELEDSLQTFFTRYKNTIISVIKNNKKIIRYGGIGFVMLASGIVIFLTGAIGSVITPSLLSLRGIFSLTENELLHKHEVLSEAFSNQADIVRNAMDQNIGSMNDQDLAEVLKSIIDLERVSRHDPARLIVMFDQQEMEQLTDFYFDVMQEIKRRGLDNIIEYIDLNPMDDEILNMMIGWF